MPASRRTDSYVIPDDGWEVPNATEMAKLTRLARLAERSGGFNGVLPVRRVAVEPDGTKAPAVNDVIADPNGQPVVFSMLAKDWLVRQRGRYELMRRVGAVRLKLRPCMSLVEPRYAYRDFGEISLSDFFGERSPVVGRYMLCENEWHRVHRALRGGYEVPRQLYCVGERPLFVAGRKGTGVSFQRHAESWMAQAFGRKVWVLVPGTHPRPTDARAWWRILPLNEGSKPRCGWCAKRAAPGAKPSKQIFEPLSTANSAEPATGSDAPGGRAAAASLVNLPANPSLPADARICLAHPGDIVFVPRGWWHASVNIDDLNIGIGWAGPCDTWDEAMKAVLTGDMESVERFVSTGERASRGALRLAAQAGDGAMLKVLLEKAGGMQVLKEGGVGDLTVACANTGQVEMLEQLRDAGADVVQSQDSINKSTALHCAANCGHVRMFSWLMSCNADIEASDSWGKPIHYAAYRGHIEVLSVLMAAKAEIDGGRAAVASEDAPLLAAWGKKGITEALMRCGDQPGDVNAIEAVRPMKPVRPVIPGTVAAGVEDVPSVLQLLQWRTPLHLAAAQGRSVVTATLLASQADPNAVDAWGLTPFNYADAAGHKKVALQVAAAAAEGGESSNEDSANESDVRTEPDHEPQ